MQVNPISNYNTQTPNFKAHIPNTLGKKSADALAKKFLASKDSIKIDIANKYLAGIKKLENSKKIKEVIMISSDFSSSPLSHIPYIKYDGLDEFPHTIKSESMRKLKNKLSSKNQDSFKLMNIIIENTRNLSEFIRENLI